jgi:transcriptional regulator with XRE-family HTH domain
MPSDGPKARVLQDFAERLNVVCGDRGIAESNRARHLARVIGITPKGASKWLNGFGMPEVAHAVALANYLGVDFNWLIAGQTPALREPNVPTKYIGSESFDVLIDAMPHGARVLLEYYLQSLDQIMAEQPTLLLHTRAEREQYKIWRESYSAFRLKCKRHKRSA